MGFNKVYRSLQEVFPQIDARVLRAVAIEHSKDADAAVEAVLMEIIPFFSERSRPITPLTGSITVGESSQAPAGATTATQIENGPSVNTEGSTEVQLGYNVDAGGQQAFYDANDGHTEPTYDTYDGPYEREYNTSEFALSENIIKPSTLRKIDIFRHGEAAELMVDKDNVKTLQIEGSGDLQADEKKLADKYPESGIKISSDNISCQTLGTLLDLPVGINKNTDLFQERVEYGTLETDLGTTTNDENNLGKYWADNSSSVVGLASLAVDNQAKIPTESNVQSVVLPDTGGSNFEESGASLSNDTASQTETSSNIIGTEDTTLNESMSESSQMRIIEVLEEAIADAKNNKKALFSAMESVISLMKVVELKEQAAEQAKVEAAMGGTDILNKIEELKQMMQHAKEANSMHAGEVYGEKSILASELRELQSRVLSLSDERDKSLAVVDEMRDTLEVQLAEAENEIKSADQGKVEKEKAAKKALADQEVIMEKVVQESKILKQQAEDNAKLREFLVDRGHVVDMLQGEMAVICQDVKLLKEKFDKRVPFSKSLSSSQTSCILASSGSSSNSWIAKQVESSVPEGASDSLETQKKTDAVHCFDEQSSEEKVAEDDRQALLEDGWELFDDCETFS